MKIKTHKSYFLVVVACINFNCSQLRNKHSGEVNQNRIKQNNTRSFNNKLKKFGHFVEKNKSYNRRFPYRINDNNSRLNNLSNNNNPNYFNNRGNLIANNNIPRRRNFEVIEEKENENIIDSNRAHNIIQKLKTIMDLHKYSLINKDSFERYINRIDPYNLKKTEYNNLCRYEKKIFNEIFKLKSNQTIDVEKITNINQEEKSEESTYCNISDAEKVIYRLKKLFSDYKGILFDCRFFINDLYYIQTQWLTNTDLLYLSNLETFLLKRKLNRCNKKINMLKHIINKNKNIISFSANHFNYLNQLDPLKLTQKEYNNLWDMEEQLREYLHTVNIKDNNSNSYYYRSRYIEVIKLNSSEKILSKKIKNELSDLWIILNENKVLCSSIINSVKKSLITIYDIISQNHNVLMWMVQTERGISLLRFFSHYYWKIKNFREDVLYINKQDYNKLSNANNIQKQNLNVVEELISLIDNVYIKLVAEPENEGFKNFHLSKLEEALQKESSRFQKLHKDLWKKDVSDKFKPQNINRYMFLTNYYYKINPIVVDSFIKKGIVNFLNTINNKNTKSYQDFAKNGYIPSVSVNN